MWSNVSCCNLLWIMSSTGPTCTDVNIATNTNMDIFIVVPHSKGLSKSFKSICGKAGVQVCLKGNDTPKDLVVVPKDRVSIVNKGAVIYRHMCDHPGCTMEYIS